MRVVVNYNVNELESCIDMVLQFNSAAKSYGWTREYVRASIFDSMESFRDPDVRCVGTMGYELYVENEYINKLNGARTIRVGFRFSVSCYGKTWFKPSNESSISLGEAVRVIDDDERRGYEKKMGNLPPMIIILKEEIHPERIIAECIGPFNSYNAAAAEAERLYYDPRNYASPERKFFRFIVRELSAP